MANRSGAFEIPPLVTDWQIQRILRAVGTRYVPPDLDRERLAADLSRAVFGYEVRRLFQHPPTEQAVRERLKRLAEAVDGLDKELPTRRNRLHWELLNILDNEEGASHGSLAKFYAHLHWLKMLVARVRTRDKAVITPLSKEPWGAEYWLFGEELPTIFARHFGRKAGRSRPRPGKAATGPYIRFALAVADLLGVRKSTGQPYGAETIVKALQKYRKLGKQERDKG
jgi:hypothetical protein